MICYIDGGCNNLDKQNPNPYYSFKIYDDTSQLIIHEARNPNIAANTSNEAEYWSLIKCLEFISIYGNINYNNRIYSDSRLLVNQVNGLWNINVDRLQELRNKVEAFKIPFMLVWVPREVIVKELGH